MIKGASFPASFLVASASSIKTSVDEGWLVPVIPIEAEFFTVSRNLWTKSGPKYPCSDQISSRSSRRR